MSYQNIDNVIINNGVNIKETNDFTEINLFQGQSLYKNSEKGNFGNNSKIYYKIFLYNIIFLFQLLC